MSIPLMYLIGQDDVIETLPVKRAGRIHYPYDENISYFTHLSKNLWNQAHHIIYGYYKKFKIVPSYEELDNKLNNKSYYKKNPDFDNYHKLGSKTAQQILKLYIKAWISYIKGRKDYFENPDKDYTGEPKEPGYKKKDGEFILIFTNQQIKFKEKKNGSVYMTFPKIMKDKNNKTLKILLGNANNISSYILDLLFGKFNEVRIIPKGTGYWIEIVCNKEIINEQHNIKKYNLSKDKIIAIDLGVVNLATLADNIGHQPIVINSDILKAENQFYNKSMSELNSVYDREVIGCKLDITKDEKGNIIKYNKPDIGLIVKHIKNQHGDVIGCKIKRNVGDIIKYLTIKDDISGRCHTKITIITENRNNFIMDVMHKVSKYIVEYALSIHAGKIVFGRNPLWKQRVAMGRKSNQNFVSIPHAKLIKLTRYKAFEYGIEVLDDTEEYTSKCSFLESESLEHHDVYAGRRVHRGLFVSPKGIIVNGKKINTINSDVQGAYNILRNVDPKFSIETIMEGVGVHGLVPHRLSVLELMTESYQQLRMNSQLKQTIVNNLDT